MALSGSIINAVLIIAGALAGLVFKKILSDRLKDTLLQAVGLIVIFVGIGGAVSAALTYEDGAFGTKDTLIMILAMVLGTVIGELINIEKQLERFGAFCQKKLVKENAKSTFAEGLVTASLIFVVGAMAVVGALDNGIRGDDSTLVAKGVIDCITSVVLASTLGIGVMFSAVPVFVYQGAIALLGVYIEPFLTSAVISQMSFTGSILIFAIGVNMLGFVKIKVGNMLPAIFMPILFDIVTGVF
ncbi:MAG: DUF554 domain-containing protein [Ruminococcaceae bacterium]|nr:DUF554 domain-containing protein [Oscillospiraceae bacterium]